MTDVNEFHSQEEAQESAQAVVPVPEVEKKEKSEKGKPGKKEKPKKIYVHKKRGFFGFLFSMVTGFLTAVGFGVVALFVFFCILIYSAGNKTRDFKFPNNKILAEKVVKEGGASKVLVVDLNGMIMGDGSYASSQGSIEPVIKQLRYAADKSSIRAVILQVSSGGGGLTASDILYNEINNIRKKGKIVVASIGAMAASGAYYTIAPVDHIVISPTGMAGSFGVIMNRMNIKELMNKIGVLPEPLMSTDMKDLGSPFRDLTEEEKQYFMDILNTYHNRFVKIISEGRDIPVADVKKLASGKLFTAEESIEYKLADSIGYFEDALTKAEELAEIKGATIIRYKNPYPWMDFFKMESRSGMSEKKLAESIVNTLLEISDQKSIDAR